METNLIWNGKTVGWLAWGKGGPSRVRVRVGIMGPAGQSRANSMSSVMFECVIRLRIPRKPPGFEPRKNPTLTLALAQLRARRREDAPREEEGGRPPGLAL